MQLPLTAMTWELWRLSRRSLGLQLALAVMGGVLTLTVAEVYGQRELGATLALAILGGMCVVSSAWARGLDNRPGFPLYLGYARPVPTWVLAAVPMVYLALSSALVYLVPATVLRLLFGVPFPLVSVAALVIVVALVLAAIQWWTHRKTAQAIGSYLFMAAAIVAYRTLHPVSLPGNDFPPASWGSMFALSAADYMTMGALGVIAVGLTVVGVARQRQGEDTFGWPTTQPDAGRGARVLGWLVDPWRGPCPTSSATRAQLWLETGWNAGEVLGSGLAVAVGIPLLLVVSNYYRWDVAAGLVMISPVLPLLAGMGRMLGLERRQGTLRLSGFAATRAIGTSRLVAMKVGVTVVGVLGAWAVIAASIWLSMPLFDNLVDADVLRQRIVAPLTALSVAQLAGAGVLFVLGLATVVAWSVPVQAGWLLAPRPMVVGILGAAFYGLAMALAVAAGLLPGSVITAHLWVLAALVPIGMAYLVWRAVVDEVVTVGAAGLALAVWSAMVVWLTVSVSVWDNDLPLAIRALGTSLSLLPLAAVAAAPWSFSLIRHR
jgi:hypothetical protein